MQQTRGSFVWHDLITTDAAGAESFLGALLDWRFGAPPATGGRGRVASVGGIVFGGLFEERSIPHSHWLGYVECGSVDDTVASAARLGGECCVPPTDLPGIGRFAVVADPQGAVFALFAGAGSAPPVGAASFAPGMTCWNELWVPDPARAAAFYIELFGWRCDVEPSNGAEYRTLRAGGREIGGITTPPDGHWPYWCPYFFVLDLDASVARAAALGGRVRRSSAEIPGVGRYALLAEPTGATFALFAGRP
jgi:predicted enzyme related to lactoylglutathione lyase